jgi:hypothetical protein
LAYNQEESEMMQKIAVAVVHGIGKQDENFAVPLEKKLRKCFARNLRNWGENLSDQLIIEPVYWQPVLQDKEDILWQNLKLGGILNWRLLRRFMIDFASDAVAYQPSPGMRETYDQIHKVMAQSLSNLAQKAGEKAPLCIIAHSLGTVITSNYIYDLQVEFLQKRSIISESVKKTIGETPLEHGETIASLFTMGSPIALWALRYSDFGSPINIPSPKLESHWSGLSGGWVNFYNCNDIIGYPMKSINPAYAKAVAEDRSIRVGNLLTFWNPGCHTTYWNSRRLVKAMARSLADTWLEVNGKGTAESR